jgi:hypothetical protein
MAILRSSGARTATRALLACLCVALFAAAYADARSVHPRAPAALPHDKPAPQNGTAPAGQAPPAKPPPAKPPPGKPAPGKPKSGASPPGTAPQGSVPSPRGNSQPGKASHGRTPHGEKTQQGGLSSSSGPSVEDGHEQGSSVKDAQVKGAQAGSGSNGKEPSKGKGRKGKKGPHEGGSGGPHPRPPTPAPIKDKAPEKSALRNNAAVGAGVPSALAPAPIATPASAAPPPNAVAVPATGPVRPSKSGPADVHGRVTGRHRAAGRRSRTGARHAARTSRPLPAGRPGLGFLAGATTPTTSPPGSTDPKRASHPRSHARTLATSNPLSGIGKHIPLPIPVPDWSKPIIIALLVLAGWFAVRWALVALRARRLERQRATLLHDLGAMQAALVPVVPARLGGLAVSVAYRPAAGPAAGGDFYDLFVIEPGKVAIMLGDVAGHGEEALTHAALTRYTLRAYLQAGLEPRAALALAGRVLTDPAGERYATVAVGVFDARSGKLTYALAGHPPPIVRASHAHEPVTSCSSPAIGWGLPTGRRQTIVSLPAGAEVCFFSDGLMEARADGTLLGRERLAEILAALGSRRQATNLLEGVRAAAEATPDDMVACILAPEKTAGGEPVHVEELETDAHALSAGHVERFLADCRVSAGEATRALALAQEIAAVRDTVLLRVETGRDGIPTVTVASTGSRRARAAARRDPEPPGEPLLELLAAG